MTYHITNEKMAISIRSEKGFIYLNKTGIQAISFVRDDIFRIDTDYSPDDIYLRFRDIGSPVFDNVFHLVRQLNDWLTEPPGDTIPPSVIIIRMRERKKHCCWLFRC